MSSDLQVVAPVLGIPTAGDLVDAIRRKITDVPAALTMVVGHREDDEVDEFDEEVWGPVCPGDVLLELLDDEVDGPDAMRWGPVDPDRLPLEVLDSGSASADHDMFFKELRLISHDMLSAGVPRPLGEWSRSILGDARRRRRPGQTNRSMSLIDGFTVWLPEICSGFHIYPYKFLTQSHIRHVAECAAGRQGWADVRLDKIADQCRGWITRRISYQEGLQAVAVAALAEITSGFVDFSDAYWGPLVPAPPDEFLLRYTQSRWR